MQNSMSHIVNDTDYRAWIRNIAGRYRQHQIKAAMHVGDEMIQLYWSIGRDIVELHVENRWGQSVLKQLSEDLSRELDRKGFSVTSLGYMKRFYLLYSEDVAIRPQLGGEFDFPDAGQLAGYMGMVDAILNTPGDNECIGLLICRSKNNVFAQYALSKITAPMGVAEYDLQRVLPTPEELEQSLKQF